MISSNAGQLAAVYRQRAERMSANLQRAERENLEALRRKAVEYSSPTAYNSRSDTGPHGGQGRPYARANPHPPLPPFMVNVQTGRFRDGWRTEQHDEGGDLVGTLYNTAPHSGFFGGQPTKTMIGRPILQAVTQSERSPAFARVVTASRKAIGKGVTVMSE